MLETVMALRGRKPKPTHLKLIASTGEPFIAGSVCAKRADDSAGGSVYARSPWGNTYAITCH
jgi:hypothetical protein